MQIFRLTVLIGFCFILTVGVISVPFGHDAYAQSKKKKPVPEQQTTKNNLIIRTLPPAYDEQLNRLSEVLGSLHYLRTLCGANEGQKWRNEMQEIVVAEAADKNQKEIMIARFNRGFRSYREIYRKCTPAASQAAAEHLREGVKLASEIPSRFGS